MRCETTVGTEKRKRLVGVSLNAIHYRHGARAEITYFNHRAKRVLRLLMVFYSILVYQKSSLCAQQLMGLVQFSAKKYVVNQQKQLYSAKLLRQHCLNHREVSWPQNDLEVC